MSRRVRTGFAWERDTSAPFIHVSWDRRRGASISLRGTPAGRWIALGLMVASWAVIIGAFRGCGGGFA